MPLLVGWLLNGLRVLFASRIGLWIATAAVWLGITAATQTVLVAPALNQLFTYVDSFNAGNATGAIGTAALQWMGVLKFDIFITMIAGAITTKHAVGATKLFLKRRAA